MRLSGECVKMKNETKETKQNKGKSRVRYTPYSETVRETHPQGLMIAARHTIRSQMWNMRTCIPHIPFQRVGRTIAGPQATRRREEDEKGNALFEKTDDGGVLPRLWVCCDMRREKRQ
jgi:aconitase B